MMFPKRWKGQLRGHCSCSPIHCLQIYASPLFFLFSAPTPTLFLSHIFDIINIDRAVHLEPFYNNWLWSFDIGINGECWWMEKEGGRVLNWYERFMSFHTNNPPNVVLRVPHEHTHDLIIVIVTHTYPSSHHHNILSLAKCRLFMDISWECSDEVILAKLWPVLLEPSWCSDPPCLNDDHQGPPSLDGFQSARLNHSMNLTEWKDAALPVCIHCSNHSL